MKSFVSLLVITIFSISISTLSAPSAWALSATFDQKVSVNDEPITSFQVTIKDKKVRAESSFQQLTAVMIKNETGYYSYIPKEKTATKIPNQLQPRNIIDDLPDFKGFLEKVGGKKTSSETVDGEVCDVYDFKDPINQENAKAWLSQTKNFPLKIEIKTPEGTTRIEFRNVKIDAPIDDALFTIPADVNIVDMSAAMAKTEDVDDKTLFGSKEEALQENPVANDEKKS